MEINKNKKLKIMTIFGTRPEIIKLSRIFAKFDKYLDHVMVHTGQSFDYEMNKIFFDELKIRKPDYFLEVKSETLGGQIANVILKSEEVFIKEKPDSVFIFGDTNSSLACIVAKRMKIPIFHMEAGNRCFSDKVPEEINRRIIDHISDINIPLTENSRLYLIQEGIHPGTIYVTGSPQAEILEFHKEKIDSSKILKKLELSSRKYFVASIHREENVDNHETLARLLDSLNSLAEIYKIPIILSTHPRTAKRLEEHKIKANGLINFHKPFGFFDYNKLQKNAFCVISDSGTIQEESSILGFPAIQIREVSERPEAFDEGVLILSGLDKSIILKAIEITTEQFRMGEKFNIPRNYIDKNVSNKVLRLVTGLSKIIKNKRSA